MGYTYNRLVEEAQSLGLSFSLTRTSEAQLAQMISSKREQLRIESEEAARQAAEKERLRIESLTASEIAAAEEARLSEGLSYVTERPISQGSPFVWESVFKQGVKVRTDIAYYEPMTGKRYIAAKSVYGSAPSEESLFLSIKEQKETGNLLGIGLNPVVFEQLEYEIPAAREREARESKMIEEANRLGVGTTYAEVAKAQKAEQEAQQAEAERQAALKQQAYDKLYAEQVAKIVEQPKISEMQQRQDKLIDTFSKMENIQLTVGKDVLIATDLNTMTDTIIPYAQNETSSRTLVVPTGTKTDISFLPTVSESKQAAINQANKIPELVQSDYAFDVSGQGYSQQSPFNIDAREMFSSATVSEGYGYVKPPETYQEMVDSGMSNAQAGVALEAKKLSDAINSPIFQNLAKEFNTDIVQPISAAITPIGEYIESRPATLMVVQAVKGAEEAWQTVLPPVADIPIFQAKEGELSVGAIAGSAYNYVREKPYDIPLLYGGAKLFGVGLGALSKVKALEPAITFALTSVWAGTVIGNVVKLDTASKIDYLVEEGISATLFIKGAESGFKALYKPPKYLEGLNKADMRLTYRGETVFSKPMPKEARINYKKPTDVRMNIAGEPQAAGGKIGENIITTKYVEEVPLYNVGKISGQGTTGRFNQEIPTGIIREQRITKIGKERYLYLEETNLKAGTSKTDIYLVKKGTSFEGKGYKVEFKETVTGKISKETPLSVELKAGKKGVYYQSVSKTPERGIELVSKDGKIKTKKYADFSKVKPKEKVLKVKGVEGEASVSVSKNALVTRQKVRKIELEARQTRPEKITIEEAKDFNPKSKFKDIPKKVVKKEPEQFRELRFGKETPEQNVPEVEVIEYKPKIETKAQSYELTERGTIERGDFKTVVDKADAKFKVKRPAAISKQQKVQTKETFQIKLQKPKDTLASTQAKMGEPLEPSRQVKELRMKAKEVKLERAKSRITKALEKQAKEIKDGKLISKQKTQKAGEKNIDIAKESKVTREAVTKSQNEIVRATSTYESKFKIPYPKIMTTPKGISSLKLNQERDIDTRNKPAYERYMDSFSDTRKDITTKRVSSQIPSQRLSEASKRDTSISQSKMLNTFNLGTRNYIDIANDTRIDIKTDIVSKVEQKQRQRQLPKEIPRQRQRLEKIELIEKPIEDRIINAPMFPFGGGMQKKPQYYDVYAKERGEYIKVNKESLPPTKALNLGAEAVDNTASATFKLKKAQMKKQLPDDVLFATRDKFTQKDRNTYTEKNTYRIDTTGELMGITVKGWLANRNRRYRI